MKSQPVRHQYRHRELIIKLNWKWSDVGIPESAVVLWEREGSATPEVALQLKGPWCSFEQAMTEVILAAELWVDCQ
jgi:hypothetical protein